MKLTLKRSAFYAFLTLIVGVTVIVPTLTPRQILVHSDFGAFYNAGRIVNEHPHDRLYDQDLQKSLYDELAPGNNSRLFFAYTPFFSLLFAPLAALPYFPALILWMSITIALFVTGFYLVWNAAALPVEHRTRGLILAVSFLPLYAWSVLSGQVSAFGFFWLALAIYLDKKERCFLSGCALALLLYKPPLLLLIVPMLIVTKRWHNLFGFSVVALILALLSLALIGLSGVPRYLAMLRLFSELTASYPNGREIDAVSFFLPFAGSPLAYAVLAGLSAIALPFIIKAWRANSETAWSHAIIWTLVLNFYVLLYDSTLVILAVMISVGALIETPATLRWLLLFVFVTPWAHTGLAQSYGFRPMTVALIALGCYCLWLSRSYFTSREISSAVPSREYQPR